MANEEYYRKILGDLEKSMTAKQLAAEQVKDKATQPDRSLLDELTSKEGILSGALTLGALAAGSPEGAALMGVTGVRGAIGREKRADRLKELEVAGAQDKYLGTVGTLEGAARGLMSTNPELMARAFGEDAEAAKRIFGWDPNDPQSPDLIGAQFQLEEIASKEKQANELIGLALSGNMPLDMAVDTYRQADVLRGFAPKPDEFYEAIATDEMDFQKLAVTINQYDPQSVINMQHQAAINKWDLSRPEDMAKFIDGLKPAVRISGTTSASKADEIHTESALIAKAVDYQRLMAEKGEQISLIEAQNQIWTGADWGTYAALTDTAIEDLRTGARQYITEEEEAALHQQAMQIMGSFVEMGLLGVEGTPEFKQMYDEVYGQAIHSYIAERKNTIRHHDGLLAAATVNNVATMLYPDGGPEVPDEIKRAMVDNFITQATGLLEQHSENWAELSPATRSQAVLQVVRSLSSDMTIGDNDAPVVDVVTDDNGQVTEIKYRDPGTFMRTMSGIGSGVDAMGEGVATAAKTLKNMFTPGDDNKEKTD